VAEAVEDGALALGPALVAVRRSRLLGEIELRDEADQPAEHGGDMLRRGRKRRVIIRHAATRKVQKVDEVCCHGDRLRRVAETASEKKSEIPVAGAEILSESRKLVDFRWGQPSKG
jgi:hypothetical protein